MNTTRDAIFSHGMHERAEPLRPLLFAMLARMRQAQETPLDFGDCQARIVGDAWHAFVHGAASHTYRSFQDTNIDAALNFLIASSLGADAGVGSATFADRRQEPPQDSPEDADDVAKPFFGPDGERRLAAWQERACSILRSVDYQALEILELRLAGRSDREIAERLGLGLRLARRIIADLRNAWSDGPDSSTENHA